MYPGAGFRGPKGSRFHLNEPNFNAAEARTGELDFLSAEAAAKAVASHRTPKGFASHENPRARRHESKTKPRPTNLPAAGRHSRVLTQTLQRGTHLSARDAAVQ